MVFMVNNFLNSKDYQNLFETFKSLDKQNKGVLTKEELRKGLMKFSKENYSFDLIDSLFDEIDTNNSGFIEYTGNLIIIIRYSLWNIIK